MHIYTGVSLILASRSLAASFPVVFPAELAEDVHTDVVCIRKQSNTSQGIRGKEKSNNDNRFKGFIKSCTVLT